MNVRRESTTSLLAILLCYVTYHILRVCLFGGEIWWMENFGEKIGEKMGLCVVCWEEGKENWKVGPRHFPPRPTQNFSLQNGEKREMKMQVACKI